MKVLLFISFFFLHNFSSKSQNLPTYNSFINKAEISIIDSLYDSALVYYNKAFTKESKPFAKDYYNAALTAIKVNKFEVADQYLFKLADLGYIVDSLISRRGFEKYVKSVNFTKLKKSIVPGKTIFPIKNLSLRYSIDTLVRDDQYFRLRNPYDYMMHEYARIIKELDSINAYKFIAIIKKYGYPNESLIGLHENHLYANFTNALIQHHQFGSPTRSFDFAPILLNALRNCEITTNNGMSLYTLSAGRDSLFGSGCFFYIEQPDGTNKFAYYKEFKNGWEEKFNKNRITYNLESLDDYRKKVIYTLKHDNEFYSDINVGVSVQRIDKQIAPFYKNVTYIE